MSFLTRHCHATDVSQAGVLVSWCFEGVFCWSQVSLGCQCRSHCLLHTGHIPPRICSSRSTCIPSCSYKGFFNQYFLITFYIITLKSKTHSFVTEIYAKLCFLSPRDYIQKELVGLQPFLGHCMCISTMQQCCGLDVQLLLQKSLFLYF